MSASYGNTTVGTAAVQIVAANNNRKGITLYNNGASTMYIGPDSSITTSNAIPILPQSGFETSGLLQGWRGAIYGIVASSTVDCRYWEWNQ